MGFKRANSLGKKREPFLVVVDFLVKNVEVFTKDELEKSGIKFRFDDVYRTKKHNHSLEVKARPFSEYKAKFDEVIEQIKQGNSYLLNLTMQTPIGSKLSLDEIFSVSNAKFKLLYKDKFVTFSPERFVKIKQGKIHTYPMKGTIKANIKDAKNIILNDQKELAEHTMVVDLLRNDLNIVAKDVKVDSFREVELIDGGGLLQVSSHISGDLDENWHENIGTILQKLLPAGSISGTPKRKTLQIIKQVEGYERGFYSGIFGYFDGESFDSAVMIRFIEKTKDGYVYKSGGGITLDSSANSEYKELLDKIYIP